MIVVQVKLAIHLLVKQCAKRTWSAYLMNGVIMEFARQCVIQTLNVVLIRYAKTVCVLEVVTAILHVPMIKRVLTNNVELLVMALLLVAHVPNVKLLITECNVVVWLGLTETH